MANVIIGKARTRIYEGRPFLRRPNVIAFLRKINAIRRNNEVTFYIVSRLSIFSY